MPSGYTSQIYEHTNTTAAEFLSKFCGLSHVPVLDSHFYEGRLAEAQKKLEEQATYTDEDWHTKYQMYLTGLKQDLSQVLCSNIKTRTCYESVLYQVSHLHSEDPYLQGVLTQALKHLTDCMEHDVSDNPGKYYQPLGFDDWRQYMIESPMEDITRYTARITEARETYATAMELYNKLRGLVDSLPK